MIEEDDDQPGKPTAHVLYHAERAEIGIVREPLTVDRGHGGRVLGEVTAHITGDLVVEGEEPIIEGNLVGVHEVERNHRLHAAEDREHVGRQVYVHQGNDHEHLRHIDQAPYPRERASTIDIE